MEKELEKPSLVGVGPDIWVHKPDHEKTALQCMVEVDLADVDNLNEETLRKRLRFYIKQFQRVLGEREESQLEVKALRGALTVLGIRCASLADMDSDKLRSGL